MASLPDQNGDSAPNGGGGSVRDSQRTIPTPFLTKTYELVDDPEADDLISWSEGGSTFIVWRPAEFARDVLPKYFKHNNFSSFVRQLNTYGFRKVVPDRWEFANDCFKRGEKGLLREIQRRKISPAVSASTATVAAAAMVTAAATVTAAALPVAAASVSPANSGDEQVISSNSSPMTVPPPMAPLLQRSRSCTTAEILEENERLRKENMQLSHELAQLRGLCNNILAMMTNYASGQLTRGGAVAEDKRQRPPPAMDLSPVKKAEETENAAVSGDAKEEGSAEEEDMEEDQQEEETTPKLFGVSIGVKRVRRDEEEEEEEVQDQERQNQGSDEVVKSEPSDGSSKHDKEEATWLELRK